MKQGAQGSALAVVLIVMSLWGLIMLSALKGLHSYQLLMRDALQIARQKRACRDSMHYGLELARLHAQEFMVANVSSTYALMIPETVLGPGWRADLYFQGSDQSVDFQVELYQGTRKRWQGHAKLALAEGQAGYRISEWRLTRP